MLYQVDAMWYSLLSLPRALSHLEIKHNMPCSERLWSVPTASAWGHLSLVKIHSGASIRYITVVQSRLAQTLNHTSALLDAHGLALIILFLMSSVREVSGWTTMTGRICLERFEVEHS